MPRSWQFLKLFDSTQLPTRARPDSCTCDILVLAKPNSDDHGRIREPDTSFLVIVKLRLKTLQLLALISTEEDVLRRADSGSSID